MGWTLVLWAIVCEHRPSAAFARRSAPEGETTARFASAGGSSTLAISRLEGATAETAGPILDPAEANSLYTAAGSPGGTQRFDHDQATKVGFTGGQASPAEPRDVPQQEVWFFLPSGAVTPGGEGLVTATERYLDHHRCLGGLDDHFAGSNLAPYFFAKEGPAVLAELRLPTGQDLAPAPSGGARPALAPFRRHPERSHLGNAPDNGPEGDLG